MHENLFCVYCILTSILSGGAVLWTRAFTPAASHTAASSNSPVNCLVREALIEGRSSDGKYEKDGYAVKWTFVNDLELIFVVRTASCVLLRATTKNRNFA